MRARLAAALGRLRAAGVLGIGVLVGCAAFYLSALAPAARELAERGAAHARAQGAAGESAAILGGAARLRRLYAQFPEIEAAAAELQRIDRLARAVGLDLSEGDYRLERKATGLWAYRAAYPVRGTYPQLRRFVDAVLKDLPAVSVDALRFERRRAGDAQLEAQLRLTIHVRPAGDLP